MRLWRICSQRYANSPLDGEGNRLYGGRWASPDVRVAYASESIALAVLESFVHYDTDLIPNNLALIAVDVPDDLAVDNIPERVIPLPDGWRAYPAPDELTRIGNVWVKRNETAVLKFPSAIVPEEWNYLINPIHPDFSKIASRIERPFAFDPRMAERK